MRAHALGVEGGLDWPAPGGWTPALIAVVACAWWSWAVRVFTVLGLPHAAALAAALAAWRLCGAALEAAWYAGWWRGAGGSVPCSRLACRIAVLSTLDVLALALVAWSASHPHGRLLASLLAGPRALAPAAVHPLAIAFAPAGALTFVRIAATASAQAQALRRGMGGPLALTLFTWLAGRLLAGFGLALVRGPVGLPS